DYLSMLHRAGIGRFRLLREDPAFREVALPVEPTGLDRMTWSEGVARATGAGASLEFALPRTTYVAGIRWRYSHPREATPVEPYVLSWKRGGQDDYTRTRSQAYQQVGGTCKAPHEETATVWIGDTLDRFRIQPLNYSAGSPPVLRISEFVLLVPAAGEFD